MAPRRTPKPSTPAGREPEWPIVVRDLLLAMERWGCEEDGIPDDAWDAYERGRAALGVPAQILPGGSEGEHYHPLRFDPKADECEICLDWAEEHPG